MQEKGSFAKGMVYGILFSVPLWGGVIGFLMMMIL